MVTKVDFQPNIIPICLPPPDIALTGKIGLVAGWGAKDPWCYRHRAAKDRRSGHR